MSLDAPFPWFGGKRRAAPEVWARFGSVGNYVEPFFGSGAVLLGRPHPYHGSETVNDLDGFVSNFWRAVAAAPDEVAFYADHSVNENDLHARHVWLVQQRETLRARLEGDFAFYDPQIAGFWAWGISCWIGSGFCSGKGPWVVNEERQLVRLGASGAGVNRQRPHVSDSGQGVNRKRPHVSNSGQGVSCQRARDDKHLWLGEWFRALADRLACVRVCSGDWSRICGPSVTFRRGVTGVFLDPPYADTAGRCSDLYRIDSENVAHAVRDWAVANGDNELMRIALCGYDGEHDMPASWSTYSWKTKGGYGGQGSAPNDNQKRERIWFSPACLESVTDKAQS